MSKKKNTHGGRRKGQTGRPPLPESQRQIRQTHRLYAWEWEALQAIGGGDVKEGIRLLLRKKLAQQILQKGPQLDNGKS